jgi:hypothetical protein
MLVRRMAGPGASALHFLLPNSALAFWAASEAARGGRSFRDGMVALFRVAGPLVAGVALACTPLIVWFAFHGALHDLLLGVFVRPSVRFARLWGPPPPSKLLTAIMLTAPFVLIAGLRYATVPKVRAAAVAAGALGLFVGVFARWDAVGVNATLIMLRSIPIILPLIALWWCVGRNHEMTRSTHSLLLIALSVTGTLVQVPSAYLPYFFYAAPLMILAAMSLMAWQRASAEGAIVFFAVFLLAAGAGHPALTMAFPPPMRWAAVPSSRAGIFVSPADSARYADLFRLMDTRPAGPVDIEFDAPELYVLMNRPNPRRTVYAILADSTEWSAVPTLRTLDRAGVQTAILATTEMQPWPAMVKLFAALREHFPRSRSAGGYEVRWLDHADASLARISHEY